MYTRPTFDHARGAIRRQLKVVSGVVLMALMFAIGGVSVTQAAVTVQGSFSGHTVADVKAYTKNTAPVSMSMTTQTAFTTSADNVVELVRGGGSAFSSFTVNGGSVSCTDGCAYGDARLDGLTFTMVDSSSQSISLSEVVFHTYDNMIQITFTGNSPVTVPAGSTLTFSFAPGKVSANPLSTDTVRTRDSANNVVIDQTATYNWFKRILFQGNGGSATNLMFEGKDFVLFTDPNPTSVLPSSLYRSGYNLVSWNTLADGTGTSYALGATFTYTALSTNLYAQWAVAPKIVTFNVNTGTGSLPQQSSTVAANLTLNNNNITKSGFAFSGWNTLANGTGTAYANGASFPFTANTTLYAQWGAASKTVTFDANGGTGSITAQSSSAAANLTGNSNSITRAGYTFNGWNTLANGTGTAYANSASFPFTANTTLYAQWTANSNVITYDSHGGSAVSDGSFVTGGSVATLPVAPTRAGYTFNGWFASATGGSALSNGYQPGATDAITLHAQWTGASNTVAYDTHGGSAVADGSFVTGGTIATLPAAPTRAGYTFNGWFASATGGSALSDGYAPAGSSSITLHAQWTGESNVITFDSHGGSAVADGAFVTGETVTALPAAPTRAGYTFQGWFLAANGGVALANGFAPSETSAITLHAQWSVSEFSVSFDANGGSGSMNQQSAATATDLALNAFTKSGYYFDGWNTQANGNGTDYANTASYPFVTNATLFAQWRAIPAAPTSAAEIQVPIGSSIDNAPVELTADGLLDQSGYTVTVHSTPQIIDQGTIWSGRLNTTVHLPAGLESGWHRLVIEGTAADGTPWTETTFFEVSPTGTFMATSDNDPSGSLANTGSDVGAMVTTSGLFVSLGISFIGMNLWLRRRRKQGSL